MRRHLLAAVLLAAASAGCEAPFLAKDGQLVFAERGGRRGASVITANGVEFMDADDIPSPILRRSVTEAWRAPTGFLLPSDGVWRESSRPVPIEGRGVGIVPRSSDTLVPSW